MAGRPSWNSVGWRPEISPDGQLGCAGQDTYYGRGDPIWVKLTRSNWYPFASRKCPTKPIRAGRFPCLAPIFQIVCSRWGDCPNFGLSSAMGKMARGSLCPLPPLSMSGSIFHKAGWGNFDACLGPSPPILA